MKAEDATCEKCIFYKPTNGEVGVCMFKTPSRNGRPQTCPQDRCGFFTDKTNLTRPLYFSGIQQTNTDADQS